MLKKKNKVEEPIKKGSCEFCKARPATITSPNGNGFCCLACQTNFGD